MNPESLPDETCLWEAAYSRFETPDQEVQKFKRRLTRVGAEGWPREAAIVELFCGRGNGLEALEQLGFRHLEGIDLSPRLLTQYRGCGTCYVADCRRLPFDHSSKDILIVQGGLHHLPNVSADLDQVLCEARRVLRPSGRLVVVEPWLTLFLRLVHVLCEQAVCRKLSNRLDALATMIRYERATYQEWLHAPDLITTLFDKYFDSVSVSVGWGKFTFVGSPKN